MRFTLILFLPLLAARAPAEDKPIPDVGPAGPVEKLHTGFRFTEGPAADPAGNLYFSDIPGNRIHKLDPAGKLTTFLEDSRGCNGLMADAKGRLVACQGGAGRVIAIDTETKKITPLAETFEGKPFERPNDLVLDRHGGVYFTDLPAGSVYYVSAAKEVSRVLTGLARPNGVILSPDEKTLYVLPAGVPKVRAYPVEGPGKLGEGKALCTLATAPGQPRGGDGLTVDTRGNLYVTRPALEAIQVLSPEGKSLGLIHFPEGPANCAFGGKDHKTLFVTARTSLYAVPMLATGHRFGAAGKEGPP